MRRFGTRLRALLVASLLVLGVLPSSMPVAAYTAPYWAFARPTPGNPDTFKWKGITLNSPGTAGAVAKPTTTCAPAKGNCEDITLQVPSGLDQSTLYVKIQWQHPAWKAYLYAIQPDGTPTANSASLGCDSSSFDRGCGNETTLNYDELTIPNPQPGVWHLKVAAVAIHNEGYTGIASLTNSAPLQYAKESLQALTQYLTRNQRVNIVFAGWTPTATELAAMKGSLTRQFQPSVAEKQGCDGDDARDGQASGLVQHETCHYTGTDPNNSNVVPQMANFVPYFEPVSFNLDYHFIKAGDNWTQALFDVAHSNTTWNVDYSQSRIPQTTETAPFKRAYLDEYNQTSGKFRGPDRQVTDPRHVDMVDGPAVEEWIWQNRLNPAFKSSFTDLTSGAVGGPQFINPDPSATYDPAWNNNGTTAVNVDRNPQGVNEGITFFLLDTFTPPYALADFPADHYHTWWTKDHVKDPDTGQPAFADNGRGWGGRYRFHMLDLGAAPTTYERSNWLSASANDNDGSAGFDPPIWQYRNDPRWNGSLPALPTQVAGNNIGSVLGFEITQGIAFKYIGAYLYRPIPNDVYVVAVNNWVDYYSTPAGGGLYSVNMDKVVNSRLAIKGLSSSAPYSTFIPGPSSTLTLGCSANRVEFTGTPFASAPIPGHGIPNASCTKSDPIQEVIEQAKSNGSGALVHTSAGDVYDLAVNQNVIRDFIDMNRPKYAPLYDGAFTVPVINIMFEKNYNVAIPLIVGGIASPRLDGEGWGQFDNVNENLVPKQAIDCSKSASTAPGCNGIPDIYRHDYNLTYTVIHEASHFLGLPHPHDGTNSVEISSAGTWTYYYSMLKWLYDISASPTTYAGDYSVYEQTDQERLMYGHTAEYLKQAQDALADSYFMDGVAGRTTPSAATSARQNAYQSYRGLSSQLFQKGDYLHAMYAMKDAYLVAAGDTEAPVAPHQVSQKDAAARHHVLFTINPQAAFDPNRPI